MITLIRRVDNSPNKIKKFLKNETFILNRIKVKGCFQDEFRFEIKKEDREYFSYEDLDDPNLIAIFKSDKINKTFLSFFLKQYEQNYN